MHNLSLDYHATAKATKPGLVTMSDTCDKSKVTWPQTSTTRTRRAAQLSCCSYHIALLTDACHAYSSIHCLLNSSHMHTPIVQTSGACLLCLSIHHGIIACMAGICLLQHQEHNAA
jgi:hypothetical protein